jgi:hypothetical protein
MTTAPRRVIMISDSPSPRVLIFTTFVLALFAESHLPRPLVLFSSKVAPPLQLRMVLNRAVILDDLETFFRC